MMMRVWYLCLCDRIDRKMSAPQAKKKGRLLPDTNSTSKMGAIPMIPPPIRSRSISRLRMSCRKLVSAHIGTLCPSSTSISASSSEIPPPPRNRSKTSPSRSTSKSRISSGIVSDGGGDKIAGGGGTAGAGNKSSTHSWKPSSSGDKRRDGGNEGLTREL